jgi:hypothetical protein
MYRGCVLKKKKEEEGEGERRVGRLENIWCTAKNSERVQ